MKKLVPILLLVVLACTKTTSPVQNNIISNPQPVVKVDSSVSAPSNVSIIHSFRMCTIKWNNSVTSYFPVLGYRIYRDTVDNPKNIISELSPYDTKYQDTGLLTGKKYYYSITSFNKYRESPIVSCSAITDSAVIGSQYVGFSFQKERFTNLQQTITFNNEPTQWDGTPDKSGIFVQLYNWIINDPNISTGFYFGFQTNLAGTGGKRGFLFSKWGTTDLKNTIVAPGGWAVNPTAAQSGEGAFVSVRKLYDWSKGTYVVTLNRDSSDTVGDWYSIHITNSKGVVDYIGSIRFDFSSKGSGILSGGGPFTEIYARVGNTPIPNWNITIDKVLADGQPPIHAKSICNGLPMNISSINNAVHLDMGYYALRLNEDGDLW